VSKVDEFAIVCVLAILGGCAGGVIWFLFSRML
jgi:hypothetical protein